MERIKRFISTYSRYPHFVLVGGTTLLINLGITFLLTAYLHIWYLMSFLFAALISWTAGFLLNSGITFRGHPMTYYARRYLGYLGSYALVSILAFALVYVMTSILHVHYLISIAVISGLMSFATFIFNKRVIYSYTDPKL